MAPASPRTGAVAHAGRSASSSATWLSSHLLVRVSARKPTFRATVPVGHHAVAHVHQDRPERARVAVAPHRPLHARGQDTSAAAGGVAALGTGRGSRPRSSPSGRRPYRRCQPVLLHRRSGTRPGSPGMSNAARYTSVGCRAPPEGMLFSRICRRGGPHPGRARRSTRRAAVPRPRAAALPRGPGRTAARRATRRRSSGGAPPPRRPRGLVDRRGCRLLAVLVHALGVARHGRPARPSGGTGSRAWPRGTRGASRQP